MIDKKIYYAWFGKNEKSELIQNCIKSWKTYCPDYEIIEINEDNFDYNKYEFSRIAYENKNWAYVSDKAKLEYMKKHSGFYLDTDIELLKSLDEVRNNNCVVTEFAKGYYGVGVIGVSKELPRIIKETERLMTFQSPIHYTLNILAHKEYQTLGLKKETIKDVTFYNTEIFGNPRTKITDETIAIHKESNSWVNGWTGGFKPKGDFLPFKIIINNQHRKDLETNWYSNDDYFGDLILSDESLVNLLVMENGNYFLTDRIKRINGKGYSFNRYGKEKELKEIQIGDNIVGYSN